LNGAYYPTDLNASDSTLFKVGNQGDPASLRVDGSGRVILGTTAAAQAMDNTVTPAVQQHSTSAAATRAVMRWSNDAGAPAFALGKSRGTSVGTHTIVQDNDVLGAIHAEGSDGTQFQRAASIEFEVDGTPGSGDMPGAIVLKTTADGAHSPTERMRIGANGNVQLANDLAVTEGGTGASSAKLACRNLQTWYRYAFSNVALSPHTGTTDETDLVTVQIDGNDIGPNGRLRVTLTGAFSNTADDKIPRIKFGGTTFFEPAWTTGLSGRLVGEIMNVNSASSQRAGSGRTNASGFGTNSQAAVTASIDTTANQNLVISAQLEASGDSFTLQSYLIEVLYGA
jgi:hypothetical protein